VKTKELKRVIKNLTKELKVLDEEFMKVSEHNKTLKGNEDHLLHDLVK
jgi:DNA repair exonuclease SbcCD ATPase subunit